MDDNLRSQFKYGLPLLKKYNIKAFFFIYTSVYEKKNYEFEVFRYFYNVKYKSFKNFFNDFYKYLINSKYKNKILKIKKTKINNYLKKYKFYSIEDKYFRYLRDEFFSILQFNKIINDFMKKKKNLITKVKKFLIKFGLTKKK